jgi:hypothetical protein
VPLGVCEEKRGEGALACAEMELHATAVLPSSFGQLITTRPDILRCLAAYLHFEDVIAISNFDVVISDCRYRPRFLEILRSGELGLLDGAEAENYPLPEGFFESMEWKKQKNIGYVDWLVKRNIGTRRFRLCEVPLVQYADYIRDHIMHWEFLVIHCCASLGVVTDILRERTAICGPSAKLQSVDIEPVADEILDIHAIDLCLHLQTIALTRCKGLDDVSGLSVRLKRLTLFLCHSIASLAPPGTFRQLEQVDIIFCLSLSDLSALEGCSALKRLTMVVAEKCPRIVNFDALTGCINLTSITLCGFSWLLDISALGHCVNLKEVRFEGCSSLSNVTPLGQCTQLELVSWSDCDNVDNLRSLANCRNLKCIMLTHMGKIDSIAFVENLEHLECLQIGCGMSGLESADFSAIGSCLKMVNLKLSLCEDIAFVGRLVGLRTLNLHFCDKDLTPLSQCRQLQEVRISSSDGIDLCPLGQCRDILYLQLHNTGRVDNLAALRQCEKLSTLWLSSCIVLNIPCIGEWAALENLYIVACQGIESMRWLSGCQALRTFDYTENDDQNKRFKDLSALSRCHQLRTIQLKYCINLRSISFINDCPQLESIDIFACPRCPEPASAIGGSGQSISVGIYIEVDNEAEE